MEVKQGIDKLSRVDDRYVPKTQSGTDFYTNVRIFRQSLDTVNPVGSGRKITFSLPTSGLLDLRHFSIIADLYLDGGGAVTSAGAPIKFNDGIADQPAASGLVWKWDGTGRDLDPSFPDDAKAHITYANNVGHGLSDPFFFSLIERITIQSGGTPIADVRDLNLVNHTMMKLRWNKEALERDMATYEGYDADNGNRISGVPYSGYWERIERQGEKGSAPYFPLVSRGQPIVIRPFAYANAFLNTSDGVLPTQLMPNITIDVYFADPGMVLRQQITPNRSFAGYPNSNSGRLHYYLTNVKAEAVMGGSNSLEGALIGQGMSMTFRNYTTYTRELGSTKGLVQIQVPVTQRAVEQIMIVIRRTTDLNDITFPGKLHSWWPVQRELSRANVRINGIRRHGEDLDSRGMFQEMRRLYPSARMSDLFMDEFRDWGSNNQMMIYNAQMDYSDSLLSGVKTASQTSPIVVEFQFAEQLESELAEPLQVDIIVKHVKWCGISREAIEVIE